MNIHIKHRSKLGNFLIQIKNALHIALHYKYNVIIPGHPFLNTAYVVINSNITPEAKKITDDHSFFYKDRIKNIDNTLFDTNKDEVTTIMKSLFIFKNILSLGENDLVIHIRSGDIFSSKNPHPRYLMPPLSYYTNIIENNKYDKIYLVAEDTLNPCINRLLELYPNIIFKLQSLEKDIQIIMRATNIVISYGTFIPSLIELSDNIKKIYIPSYLKNYKGDCFSITVSETYETNLEEYYTSMIPWKNTPEQHKLILEYNCKNT